MEINRPNAKELTPEEQNSLAQLKTVVEQAIADGVLTKDERDAIANIILADKKVLPEELDIVRSLIQENAALGKLVTDWNIRL